MKRITTILTFLMLVCMGAWAESVTWESKSGWAQASGGVGGISWFGVHTPGDVSTVYSLTSIQVMQQSGYGNNENYLAIARVSASSTLNADHVVAISDNNLSASQGSATLETYNFSDGVDLLGGTTYYLVFLSSNTPTNGAYTVRSSRLSVNHTDYGTYTYGCNETTWWPYFTATLTSSSATDYYSGTNLGGTLNNGSGWSYKWTSPSPSVIMESSANNINTTANNAGGMDIRSGSAGSATYTLSAPTGYVITGYKLFGKALSGNQTVTPAEGGSAVVFTSVGNSLKVSGLRKATTSFVLSGNNTGLFLEAMQVTLSALTSITTLPTGNDKVYVINNARGTWNFADNATSMTAVTVNNTNLDSEAQQVALIYKNENYYLYSVNAGKYITASNTLTSMPTDNEQLSITATGNATYPWFFTFKNVSNANINVDGQQRVYFNSWGTLDEGNRNAILPVGDYDLTAALDLFDTRTVTYNLSYGGNDSFDSVDDVTVTIGSNPADFVPSAFVKAGVSLSYSPATITAETTEVTVTATWDGLFEISDSYASAKWCIVDMHSSEDDYTWQYDATSKEVQTPVIAKDAFESLTNANLFCFVGDPYNGFKIYNKAAGDTYTLRKAETGNTVSYMSTTDDHNLFKVYASRSIDNAYCFKIDGDTHYLNKQNLKLQGWNDNDNGSSCRFFVEGNYYLTYLNSIHLEAPAGAVGTKSGIPDETTKSSFATVKDGLAGSLSYMDDNMTAMEKTMFKTLLTSVKNSETITLADGYYRIQNAYTNFTTPRDMYYSHSNGTIRWSSGVENDVNSVFYLSVGDGTITVKSPNANKYLSSTAGALSADATDITYTQLSSTVQYNLRFGEGTALHSAGHNSGAGTEGNLTGWDGGADGCSAWYIVKASKLPVGLHTNDEVAYATLYLPFDVTISVANAYTLDQSGSWLVPTQLENNKVPAGTPVLLRNDNPAILGETAYATINTGDAFSTDNTNSLSGVYVPTDFALTDGATAEYFLGVDDGTVGFYHSGVESKTGYYTLGANKAYLATGALARGFAVNWDAEVTGVSEVIGKKSEVRDGAYYDLSGRRVQNPQHGLYIVNGKKVVIK